MIIISSTKGCNSRNFTTKTKNKKQSCCHALLAWSPSQSTMYLTVLLLITYCLVKCTGYVVSDVEYGLDLRKFVCK